MMKTEILSVMIQPMFISQKLKNTIHYSFSDKFSDSLIEGLDFIGEKMRVFISDSIATHLDHFLDGKGCIFGWII